MKQGIIFRLSFLVFAACLIALIGCEGDTTIVNNYYNDTSALDTSDLDTSDTVITYVITFDDVTQEIPTYDMGSQHALISYKTVLWDNDGIAGGWGWGVYNTSNSQPYSSPNYVMNRHGKNSLGFTFANVVRFKGAYFAKGSRNSGYSPDDPGAVSANRIRYHFYDNNLNLISSSDWFNLELTSTLFAADVGVKRVVVEHDVDNPISAQFGITDAEWFSMDNVTYEE